MNLHSIKEVLQRKGYRFFTGDKNINIIGVRMSDHLTNQFDDHLFVIMDLNGQTRLKHFDKFTTDPGDYYLKEKLLNEDGCAILKPGQYPGMLAIGEHRGKYPALVQVGPCVVYRDANRDELIDKGVEDEGVFGINLHHGYDSEEVDRNSAGCQVVSEDEDLNMILIYARLSAEKYGNSFTYTLLEESDFNWREDAETSETKASEEEEE